jgi:hypothetical protein
MSCWRPISTASRRRWKSASSTSRRWKTPASSRSSTAPSPSPRTATRWSARCRADQLLDRLRRHGRLQPGRRRRPGAVQLDGPRRSGRDIWGMDVARYGEWATLRYTNAKVRENYSPPLLASASQRGTARRPPAADHTALRRHGRDNHAVMGDSWGLETPLWFAPSKRRRGARRPLLPPLQRFRAHVGNEVPRRARSVGVTEIANFAKYEVTGPGAEAFLSHLMTNTMPKTGRIVLTPMLNDSAS